MRIQHILQQNQLLANVSLLNTARDPVLTSDRYSNIDHLAVIEALNIKNWYITEYVQVKPHKATRADFVRWLAVYENPDFNLYKGNLSPAVLHQGSHDGSCSLKLSFALRNTTNNFISVVGDLTCPNFTYKHIGDTPSPRDLPKMIHEALSTTDSIPTHIAGMMRTSLTNDQLIQFAQNCVDTRFDSDKYLVDLNSVIKPKTQNLWKQFNHIQSTLLVAQTLRVQIKGTNKPRKMKAVNGIDESLKLKKRLWNIAVRTIYPFVV